MSSNSLPTHELMLFHATKHTNTVLDYCHNLCER